MRDEPRADWAFRIARGRHLAPALLLALAAALAVSSVALAASEPRDWVERTGPSPSAREASAMAYDSARGKTVMFGGLESIQATVPYQDTWEWDGISWTQAHPLTSPSGRGFHSMAYDSLRHRIVLFGGLASTMAAGAETWEYDGVTWQRATPPVSPAPRISSAMVFDSVKDRILLFGGQRRDGYGSVLADTWEWDGVTWTELSPAVSPPARVHHAMAFDTVRDRAVLFGGWVAPTGEANDTWEWDGAGWTRALPTESPRPRRHHVMAFDSLRGTTVLHGGAPVPNGADETWEWDGVAWSQSWTTRWPLGRSLHAAAFDSAQGAVVIFGGVSEVWPGTVLADTWTYIVPPPGTPGAAPGPHSLYFGRVSIGSSSPPQTVVLLNSGSAPTTIVDIAVSAGYEIDHDCPLGPDTLAAAASCTVTVMFAPTDPSQGGDAQLVFTDNAGVGTQVVRVTGFAIAP
jgi:hypothetical protein